MFFVYRVNKIDDKPIANILVLWTRGLPGLT